MLINIADVWKDAETEHKIYVDKVIAHYLVQSGGKYTNLTSHEFGLFLTQNSAEFALGKPAELRLIIDRAKKVMKGLSGPERDDFMANAKLVFDYGTFCTKTLSPWSAYKLCVKARYTICPYCQQSFSFTIQKPKGGAFRPTLDHYYPKGRYPYLGLSLYNLVPSCYSCNSSLKTTKDFYKKKYLHPFSDAEEIGFTWDIDSYLKQRKSGKHNFEIALKFNTQSDAAKNSADIFLLNERFVGHNRMLEVFAQTILLWNENSVLNAAVSTSAFRFNFTEQHALGFDKTNYKNEMLGKIKLDLYNYLIHWIRTRKHTTASAEHLGLQ